MWFWKQCILFYLGGSAYMVLEFLWRGYSHGSMFVLGGLCFLLIGQLWRRLPSVPLAVKLVLAAIMITGLELATGLLVNQSYAVWDYRGLPYNYLGQICVNYSLLWIPVSLGAMVIYEKAERLLRR